VKRFAVVDRELTEEDGEITPTMKVKRNVVYDHYRKRVRGSVRRRAWELTLNRRRSAAILVACTRIPTPSQKGETRC